MPDIEERSFQIARYMQDRGSVGQGFISLTDLSAAIPMPEAEFRMACDYLANMDYCNYLESDRRHFVGEPVIRTGAPKHYTEFSLSSQGVHFVSEKLISRMHLTLDGEKLARYLAETQTPHITFVSEA